jgi:hypothetical protein
MHTAGREARYAAVYEAQQHSKVEAQKHGTVAQEKHSKAEMCCAHSCEKSDSDVYPRAAPAIYILGNHACQTATFGRMSLPILAEHPSNRPAPGSIRVPGP